MKKIYVSLLLAFLVTSGTVFAADSVDYVGENIVSVNLNVRSTPSLGENLIGFLTQETTVQVESTIYGWCKIPFKDYASAYVDCYYLEHVGAPISAPTLEPAPVTVSEPAIPTFSIPVPMAPETVFTPHELLSNIDVWLSSAEGNSYLDDSYWLANEKAQVWSQEAKLTSFWFEYSPLRDQYCHMVFTSETRLHGIFKAWCFRKSTGEMETIEQSDIPYPERLELPQLLFMDFVAAILGNEHVMENLDGYFEPGANVRVIFTLDKNLRERPQWKALFFDPEQRYFSVQSNADSEIPELKMERGVFLP
ncbi:MAG TPA: SH3 domain-containing protein [Candidatus Gracilibacteria bacterium]|nr:SH3 domain-containing protein [Candidatus Gracilibacteria bacterium]